MARGHTHDDALEFATAVSRAIARGLPNEVTVERAMSKRKGRLYLDALQNGRGKTIVAPYALRASEGAPVSTPLRWSEVTPALDPSQLTLRTLPKRIDKVGDLFEPARRGGQRLPRLRG